jgi:hypothetical protein
MLVDGDDATVECAGDNDTEAIDGVDRGLLI